MELTNVSAVSTLIATLEIANPQIIFLDLSLARCEPLDAVPLIVLADGGNRDCAARSLSQGAAGEFALDETVHTAEKR